MNGKYIGNPILQNDWYLIIEWKDIFEVIDYIFDGLESFEKIRNIFSTLIHASCLYEIT